MMEYTDRLTKENTEAAIATCGNCHIATGSYQGTGAYGSGNPTKLSFSFTPKLLFLMEPVATGTRDHPSFAATKAALFFPYATTNMYTSSLAFSSSYSGYVKWENLEKTLYLYSASSAAAQYNASGNGYYYWIAIY